MLQSPPTQPNPGMSETSAKFTSGSPMRHVLTMSFSSSVGLLTIFAVDFVDMFFIAMLGNPALAAAVGYAGTVLFFTTSISIGLSIASGVLVARALGSGSDEQARSQAGSVLAYTLVLAVLIASTMLLFMPNILGFLGAEGLSLQLALTYLHIVTPTMPILGAAFVSMAILRAHGDARRAMYATIAGGVVNAVLDPIFIFGFDWGLAGAAWASVVARCAIVTLALLPLLRVYQALRWPGWAGLLGDSRVIAAIAIPAILTNLATPAGMALVTREMAAYGADAVAGMAIIGRLTPVAFALIFALSGAIGPIVGQNFGAQALDRVRATLLAALKVITLYVLLVSALLYLLRVPLATLFAADGLTQQLLYLFCGPLALGFIFNGALFVGNATFNNIGHPLYSTWLNWLRHTLGTWPPAVAGGAIAGAPGVITGQVLGGAVFAALAIWLSFRSIKAGGRPKSRPKGFLRHQAMHWLAGTRHHC